MITFGLTGGIASGKSTVSEIFNLYNIPTIDADLVARQAVLPDSIGLQQIVEAFGDQWLKEDGSLNRDEFGKMVFSSKEKLSKLNDIMTPLIHAESDKQIQNLHSQGFSIVGFDAAIIIEMGNYNKYKPLILVGCPLHIQIQRLMIRNNVTYEEGMSRINAQYTLEFKKKFADYFIDTSGTKEYSIKQTISIIEKLESRL